MIQPHQKYWALLITASFSIAVYCSPGASEASLLPESNAINLVESSIEITVKKIKTDLADFPKGMTSFGATVLGNKIFVVGGKSGRAHSYAKSYQNRDVLCLNLDGSKNQWQSVGENLGLQGLAIIGYEGKIYRIGGLEARNNEGEEQDLHSLSEFVFFDPEENAWQQLPSLPTGRSSFDACVVGSRIYVVGGWNMAGDDDPVWASDMLSFDMSIENGKWESTDVPFRTRAMAVRAHQGKLVVIGGIKEAGGPTSEVHIFDLKTGKWSAGPAVPTSGGMKAFGCSAVSLPSGLFASTHDGGVFLLDVDDNDWRKVHQLESGRFFHQMLPVGEKRFALVGGSHMENGSQLEVEVFEVSSSSAATDE